MIILELWTEKYAPQNFSEIVGYNHNFEQQLDNLPHYLFYGSPGIGKTATAKVIIKKLNADYLILNSSLDRKIEVIRSKVRDFVTTMSSNNNVKIVFLDEIDGMKKDSAESLRNFIETHSKYVRFIATCNNINKITDALRSRFEEVKFTTPAKIDILKRLCFILDSEKCQYDLGAVKLLIDKLYPDIRAMVKKLQILTINGKENLTKEKVEKITTLLNQVLENIKNKDFDMARTNLLNDGVDPEDFFNELYQHLITSDLPIEKKQKINEVAMQCNFYSAGAQNHFIPTEGFLFGLMRIGI